MEGNALSFTENLCESNLVLLENTNKQRIPTVFPSLNFTLKKGKLLDNGTNTPIRRLKNNGKTLDSLVGKYQKIQNLFS